MKETKYLNTEIIVVAGLEVVKAVGRDLDEVETPEKRKVVEELLKETDEDESTE